MPSARRKRLLARRSREEGFSSDDENSNVVIGNQNQTFTSDMPEQNVNDENFPNSVSSVSNHEIRPNEPLRDMTNDENRIREIIRAETESTVNIAENMRIMSNELNNRISTEMESLFENLNDRMQGMIEGALNARNTSTSELRSNVTLGHVLENGQNQQITVAERHGNERAVSGDLYRVQSCADLRPNNMNAENAN